MRTISTELADLLRTGTCESHDLLQLTFPLQAGETVPQQAFYADAALTIGAVNYYPGLRDLPTIRMSLGRTPDRAEIQIENESLAMAATISDPANILDGADASLYRAFRLPESWELHLLITGILSDIRVEQSVIAMTLYSDLSLPWATIAADPIAEQCPYQFKDARCGYPDTSTLPPGERTHTICNKIFDSAEGCTGRGNSHRHGGAPTLAPNAAVVAGSGDVIVGGNGWPAWKLGGVDDINFDPVHPLIV